MDKNCKYWNSSHSSNSKNNLKRKIIHRIKKMNKNLHDDPLWQGRFEVRCDDIFHATYEDGSGNYATVYLTIRDKEKKLFGSKRFDDLDFTMFNGYHFWEWVNQFVCDCNMEDK